MKRKKKEKSKTVGVGVFLGDWTESKEEIRKQGPDFVEIIKKKKAKK